MLEVENLTTHFRTDRGLVKAVDGVSLQVGEGEIVGLVGESGSGKSVTVLSIMQLIPAPGKIVAGRVMFQGEDLLCHEPRGKPMCSVRGRQIAMIFQEPMTSLNPVLTVGRQIGESLKLHLQLSEREARKRCVELLEMVGVADAESRLRNYPHQFSGGMRQRVMIAMAMSCNPRLIIADEPTTALDVTTQAQLLELLADVVRSSGTSLIIVTHNLGIVARYVDRLYVMYAGRVVETGPSDDVFGAPAHPYTIGLLNSVPRLDTAHTKKRLVPIKGMMPELINLPPTCAFLPRCEHCTRQCEDEPQPVLRCVGGHHFSACHLASREDR